MLSPFAYIMLFGPKKNIPIASMGLEYLPTFPIQIDQMWVNIPYMDGMGSSYHIAQMLCAEACAAILQFLLLCPVDCHGGSEKKPTSRGKGGKSCCGGVCCHMCLAGLGFKRFLSEAICTMFPSKTSFILKVTMQLLKYSYCILRLMYCRSKKIIMQVDKFDNMSQPFKILDSSLRVMKTFVS